MNKPIKKKKRKLNKDKYLYWTPPLAIFALGSFFFLLDTTKAKSKNTPIPHNEFNFAAITPAKLDSIEKESEILPSPESRPSNFSIKRASIRYVQGTNKAIIYGTNYLSIDGLFATDCRTESIVPMLDLRAHRFNNNTYAANIGLIGRFAFQENPHIYGMNVYYDFRQGQCGNYNGLGTGLEYLNEHWDARINGYFPLGSRNHQKCNLFANTGVNAELGYTITFKSRKSIERTGLIYFAAGPYYFNGRDRNVIGGEIHMRPQYKDIFALDILGSYDNQIGAYGQIQIILSIPLYNLGSQKGKNNECTIGKRILYKPVERFEVMQLRKSHQ